MPMTICYDVVADRGGFTYETRQRGAHERLRKAGVAAVCGICCGLPMLVVAGVLTATGAAVGGLLGVAVTVALFLAGRLAFRRRRWWGVLTLLCGLAGAALAVSGLAEMAGGDGGSPVLVSAGIAALAVGALAALAPQGDDDAVVA